jgi:hypothetical protein
VVLQPNHWYFVLFDDLDRGFDPTNEEYAARTTGLLLASRDVFNWAGAEQPKLRISPTVFIRSDIYETLSFPDKNKITQNLLETLRWTDHTAGEDSLKALIDRRIEVITATESDDPWSEVFGSRLMRGSQPKFKHIARPCPVAGASSTTRS